MNAVMTVDGETRRGPWAKLLDDAQRGCDHLVTRPVGPRDSAMVYDADTVCVAWCTRCFKPFFAYRNMS